MWTRWFVNQSKTELLTVFCAFTKGYITRNTQDWHVLCLDTWLVVEWVVSVNKEMRYIVYYLQLLSYQWIGLLVLWE